MHTCRKFCLIIGFFIIIVVVDVVIISAIMIVVFIIIDIFCYCLFLKYIYERSLMVRWVIGLILHGVDPLSYFSFQPVLHDWCNKGCGMCYPVCGMLLIGKSSLLCGGSGFPFSLSEWSLTI